MPEAPQTLLGFDFGTGTIGVAVGRALLGTASPLTPLKARDGIPDWQLIQQLMNNVFSTTGLLVFQAVHPSAFEA